MFVCVCVVCVCVCAPACVCVCVCVCVVSWLFSLAGVEPEQTGPLIAPATLPTLTAEQVQALQRAKKYCQDISTKHVCLRLAAC